MAGPGVLSHVWHVGQAHDPSRDVFCGGGWAGVPWAMWHWGPCPPASGRRSGGLYRRFELIDSTAYLMTEIFPGARPNAAIEASCGDCGNHPPAPGGM